MRYNCWHHHVRTYDTWINGGGEEVERKRRDGERSTLWYTREEKIKRNYANYRGKSLIKRQDIFTHNRVLFLYHNFDINDFMRPFKIFSRYYFHRSIFVPVLHPFHLSSCYFHQAVCLVELMGRRQWIEYHMHRGYSLQQLAQENEIHLQFLK